MFEEMAVGVKLALTGNPTRQLESFTRALKKATEVTEVFNQKLHLLNQNFVRTEEILKKISPTFENFGGILSETSVATRGLNNSFTGLNRRLDGMADRMMMVNRKASMLADGLQGVRSATGTASASASAAFLAMGYGFGKGSAQTEGMVYQAGRPDSVYGRAGRIVPPGESGAAPTKTKELGLLGGLGFAGTIGSVIVASEAAKFLYNSYDAGKVYQQVLSQIMLQNIPGTNSAQINQFVNSQKLTGVSKLDLLQKLQDALVVSKNVQEAEGITPFLSQIGYANKALFEGTKQELKDQDFYALVKSAELVTGSMDANILKPVIDEMVKINNATSGQVKPTATLQMLQKTRGSLRGADPRVLYQLEPIEQEYGGAPTGVMVRALYQHLQAGRLTTPAAMQLEKMGLIKPGYAKYNKINMIQRVKPGGIVDQSLLNKDFMDWYNKYFISYFKKHHLTEQQEKMINSVIFTNSDLALVNAMVQQQEKIAKTAELNAHAMGTQQMLKQVPKQTAAEQQLSAAFFNLKKTIGDMMAPSVIGGMNVLTNFITTLNQTLIDLDRFSNSPTLNKIANLFEPDAKKTENLLNPQSASAAAQPATIQIHMDGRQVAQAQIPHLNQMLYHSQIQQSNGFMVSMTPIQPNTGVPFR